MKNENQREVCWKWHFTLIVLLLHLRIDTYLFRFHTMKGVLVLLCQVLQGVVVRYF